MNGRLRKFFALEPRRRRYLLRAFGRLRNARRALRKRPFRELVPVVQAGADPASHPGSSARDLSLAQDIGWAVRTAARYAPGDNSCLVQVLAARELLLEADVGGTIYIGAGQGGENTADRFGAHAWLKCGDEFVTGEAGHERYTVIAVVSW